MTKMTEDRLDKLAALGGDIAALVAEVKAARNDAATPTPSSQSPIRVGNTVLIRTVTNYYTGRIAAFTDAEILLDDAAWVADTGHFTNALTTGTLSDVEPYVGPVVVSRGALVDCCDWRHPLPRQVK